MGERNTSLLSRIITWTIIGIVALIVLKIAMRLLGLVFGLLFTVVPILLIGWLAVKAWKAFSKEEPAA